MTIEQQRARMLDSIRANNPDRIMFDTDTIIKAIDYYTYCQNLEIDGIVQWSELFSPTEFLEQQKDSVESAHCTQNVFNCECAKCGNWRGDLSDEVFKDDN